MLRGAQEFFTPLSSIARSIYLLSVNQVSDVKEPAGLNGYVICCYSSTVSVAASEVSACLKDSLMVFLTLVQSHCQPSGQSDALEGEVRMMLGQVSLSLS